MNLRQRLLDLRLAAECANGEAGLRRILVDVLDTLIEAEAATEREQGAPDSRIVPCYECARPAIRDGWSTPLCVACRPTTATPKAIAIGADTVPSASSGLGSIGWDGYPTGTVGAARSE